MTASECDAIGRGNMADNLELQLSEVEMLQSMYPTKQEFYLEDTQSLKVIRAFVEGQTPYECLHYRIGFVVCFQINEGTVEVVCHLPHEYPVDPPDVFTRLPPCFSRDTQKVFTENLHSYIDTMPSGDLCVALILDWIRENVPQLSHGSPHREERKLEALEEYVFIRLWIYSHHIYSKFKRRNIIDIAKELKLSGFSVPGKPGLICVEGYEEDVDDFWNRIRRMNWKKLTMKEREETRVTSHKDLLECRKFAEFEEKAFDVRGGKGREYHMDLGKVYSFLDSIGCGHIFSLYFGVEGRTSEK